MAKKQETLLLAGENSIDLDRLVVHLHNEGFRTLSVADRKVILALARSEVPCLIVLDLESCFDVCRLLKRNFVTEPIPIIAILFPADEPDRVAALELGADDCLGKPYHFRELLLRIRCSLRRAQDKKGKVHYKQAKYYAALVRSASSGKPKDAT